MRARVRKYYIIYSIESFPWYNDYGKLGFLLSIYLLYVPAVLYLDINPKEIKT